MIFLVDAQLPPALARALASAGYQSVHVFDLQLLNASDRSIWQWAAAEGATIVTKDEDFATMRRAAAAGPAVVWLRVGNTASAFLIRWLLPLMPEISAAIREGEALIELR